MVEFFAKHQIMNNPAIQTIHRLFGHCVLLKWPLGKKSANQPWKHFTLDHMTPEYLATLTNCNIGIATGRKSGGLCAIDLDHDDLIKPFKLANPWASQTTITRGARGCQIWVRIKGRFPDSGRLRRKGEFCGEWRADGHQSIVPPSIHPDTGKPYEFVSVYPVGEIFYNEIRYPEGIIGPAMEDSVDSQLPNTTNATQHMTQYTQLCPCNTSKETPNEDSPAKLSFLTVSDACQPDYDLLVEPHIATEKGHNNAKLFQLAQAVKLAETLGQTVDVERIFDLWWSHSQPFTKQTLNQDTYYYEFLRALGSIDGDPVIKAWQASATVVAPGSQRLRDAQMKRLAAFCYCLRDAEGRFYLSCRKVGTLFSLHHQDAFVWLKSLEDSKLILAVKRGSNSSRKATEYQYIGTESP